MTKARSLAQVAVAHAARDRAVLLLWWPADAAERCACPGPDRASVTVAGRRPEAGQS